MPINCYFQFSYGIEFELRRNDIFFQHYFYKNTWQILRITVFVLHSLYLFFHICITNGTCS